MHAGHVALVLLLVLAGCGGVGDPTPSATDARPTERGSPTPQSTDVPTSTATSAVTTTATATRTPASTPSETRARTLSADNPWNQRVVRVAVDDTVRDGRNTTAIAAEALAYWNAKMATYTDYAFRLRLTDDPDAARIELRFVERIEECDGPTTHAAGCARFIEPDDRARDLEVARVVSNRSNAAVVGTTKHELGHLLGLDHDAAPRFIMAQNSTTPVRDAGDRANPWYADTVRVAVDADSFDVDRATVDEQVAHAVSFYDAGADGTVPTNVTVRRTDQRHSAEILVTNDPAVCDVDGGSEIDLAGRNGDRDAAMEAYTGATVCVDVDGEALGWHVGHWLGAAFGLSADELAPAFRDADYGERRGEWWE